MRETETRLMSRPFVSVVIPTYRDWPKLHQCLEALAGQTYGSDGFEVIVVNNDPGDPCPDGVIRGQVQLIVEQKKGSYAARNAGIRKSRGEILAFTDSDCIPQPDWIEQAIRFFEANPAVSRIGGAIELFFAEAKPTAAELHETVFAFPQERYVREGGAVTANMLAKRTVFESVGLFDDSLLSGGDTHWGKQAQASGYSIGYAADACVKHPARRTARELAVKLRRTMGGLFLIGQESHGRLTTTQLVRVLTYWKALSVWKAIRTILQSRRLSHTQKLRVVAIRLYLEWVSFGETIRLQRGAGKP
jgi:glycosyltransferase involved in cell wall biosynthesis